MQFLDLLHYYSADPNDKHLCERMTKSIMHYCFLLVILSYNLSSLITFFKIALLLIYFLTGNLTKHMKSKAHGKKCLEKGVSESSVDELETEELGRIS